MYRLYRIYKMTTWIDKNIPFYAGYEIIISNYLKRATTVKGGSWLSGDVVNIWPQLDTEQAKIIGAQLMTAANWRRI